jgi:hypothetical protein
MERLVAAELHIMRETSATYRILYRRRAEPQGAVTPWRLHGQATLRVFLQQFERAGHIARILTRVEAGRRQVLDLGYVDEERVARVFRQYAHPPYHLERPKRFLPPFSGGGLLMKITSSTNLEFPGLQFSIRQGEVKDLPADPEAAAFIFASTYVREVPEPASQTTWKDT